MNQIIPKPHPDSWVNLPYGYAAAAVDGLTELGLPVRDAWLDPAHPRDFTIVLADAALVWDEERGWRQGRFIDGEQGRRTTLANGVHLGGGLLPSPAEVARRMVRPAGGRPVAYRRHADRRDGFDDAIRAWAGDGAR